MTPGTGAQRGGDGGRGDPVGPQGASQAEPSRRDLPYPGPHRRPGVADLTCERCGTEMFERHCKVICPNCGYQRDCSDP